MQTLAPLAQSAGTALNVPTQIPTQAPLQMPVSPTPVQQPLVPPTPATVLVGDHTTYAQPFIEPAAAPVAGGVTMNVVVNLITRVDIELPWGVINERFDCAFIGKQGELVVATDAPLYNVTNDDWIVEGETLVFGAVSEYAQQWRDSLTFRPDVEEVQEEWTDTPAVTQPVETEVLYVEPAPIPAPTPEPVAPVTGKIDTGHMSRSQLKRHTKRMAQRNLKPDGTPIDA